MYDDPARYWRDLTENYRRMSDGELVELAEKPEDLTEVAQQVLRDELKVRNLLRPNRSSVPQRVPPARSESSHHIVGGVFRDESISSESADLDELDEEDEEASEYTWKTLLRDCDSNEHAWQLREALKRHGIESWVRAVSASSMDVVGPQIYVAADELERALDVAAQPIPQDIVEAFNTAVPEFEIPVCPKCGSADDVVLEGADPVNAWVCEACGEEWSDPDAGTDEHPAGL